MRREKEIQKRIDTLKREQKDNYIDPCDYTEDYIPTKNQIEALEWVLSR